ncbi:MAG: right-handed parallel beta-helix repeat-containing protein [Armatimonadota bacterium]|nr:right-handed parallel beta-helix repeat-containing protein [Armatimonadota bacterium]
MSHELALFVAACALLGGTRAAPDGRGPIDITDFAEHVLNPGTEQEDWQPAFQEALKLAEDGVRPIYVPAGTYPIRQAIVIRPHRRPEGGWYQGVRIFGDGMHQSIIRQQVDSENCIDWTGETYENGASHGQLDRIQLAGGDITLNLKWHNQFRMDCCRVGGAKRYGIYTEGWSSRFLNSLIRWCGEAGLMGYAHFNNAVIRDCYIGRDRIGVLVHGGHGSRIEGCGFEHCPRAAVMLRNVKGFTVNNSYFEANGSTDSRHFPCEGPCNTLEVDFNCWGLSIHDNILRYQQDDTGALISISDVRGGHVYDNLFWVNHPTNNAIMLREGTEHGPDDWQTEHRDLIVEHNQARNIRHLLVEERPGLVQEAIANGSRFDWELGQSALEE